jgi:hypothetical protein
MLSPETLETYRRMTNSERLKLTLQMIDENIPYPIAERRSKCGVVSSGSIKKTTNATVSCSPRSPGREEKMNNFSVSSWILGYYGL